VEGFSNPDHKKTHENIKLNNLARTGSDFSTSCRKSGCILINIYADVKKYCTMDLDPRENDKIRVHVCRSSDC
jgi:hypothetical protein